MNLPAITTVRQRMSPRAANPIPAVAYGARPRPVVATGGRRWSASPAGGGRRGFTLIEIVVAFSVLALGLGIAMQIATGAMRNARHAAQRTEAALHAQSLLDIVGVGERLEEGESSGEFDDEFRWELSVSKFELEDEEAAPLEMAQAPVALYRLDLLVTWGTRERPQEARFVTLRALTPDPNG